jgi:hypothetical protein
MPPVKPDRYSPDTEAGEKKPTRSDLYQGDSSINSYQNERCLKLKKINTVGNPIQLKPQQISDSKNSEL